MMAWMGYDSIRAVEPRDLELTVHGTCPHCHHWHDRASLRLERLPRTYNGIQCQLCGHKWFGLGGDERRLSLVGRETIPTSNSQPESSAINQLLNAGGLAGQIGMPQSENMAPIRPRSPVDDDGAHARFYLTRSGSSRRSTLERINTLIEPIGLEIRRKERSPLNPSDNGRNNRRYVTPKAIGADKNANQQRSRARSVNDRDASTQFSQTLQGRPMLYACGEPSSISAMTPEDLASRRRENSAQHHHRRKTAGDTRDPCHRADAGLSAPTSCNARSLGEASGNTSNLSLAQGLTISATADEDGETYTRPRISFEIAQVGSGPTFARPEQHPWEYEDSITGHSLLGNGPCGDHGRSFQSTTCVATETEPPRTGPRYHEYPYPSVHTDSLRSSLSHSSLPRLSTNVSAYRSNELQQSDAEHLADNNHMDGDHTPTQIPHLLSHLPRSPSSYLALRNPVSPEDIALEHIVASGDTEELDLTRDSLDDVSLDTMRGSHLSD